MFGELVEWVVNLDRHFAFLLSLPFVVALAGLVSHALTEGRRERREEGYAREQRGIQGICQPRGADAHLAR